MVAVGDLKMRIHFDHQVCAGSTLSGCGECWKAKDVGKVKGGLFGEELMAVGEDGKRTEVGGFQIFGGVGSRHVVNGFAT